MFEWTGEAGLAALFVSAFVSATVLPGNSEVVLLAVLKAWPDRSLEALALATLGNTLGGLTTYGLGRLIPSRVDAAHRSVALMRRFGAWALLASWVPLVGDALCAAAGWLRLPWPRCAAAMALGKAARYLAVAQAVAWL